MFCIKKHEMIQTSSSCYWTGVYMVPGLVLVPQSHGYNVYPGLAVQPSVSFQFSGQGSVTTVHLVHAWLLIFVFVSQYSGCRSFFFLLFTPKNKSSASKQCQ